MNELYQDGENLLEDEPAFTMRLKTSSGEFEFYFYRNEQGELNKGYIKFFSIGGHKEGMRQLVRPKEAFDFLFQRNDIKQCIDAIVDSNYEGPLKSH